MLERSRLRLLQCIKDNVKDSTTRSLVEATLLNERSLLDDELWQAYSITGIVHIIAISGMHVAILFAVILFLLRWFPYKRLDWVKYLIALPLVWAYIALPAQTTKLLNTKNEVELASTAPATRKADGLPASIWLPRRHTAAYQNQVTT